MKFTSKESVLHFHTRSTRLLARIGGLFMMQGLDIHSARIATLGEKAEDIFFVTKKDGTPLTDAESEVFVAQLKAALCDEASNQVSGQN